MDRESPDALTKVTAASLLTAIVLIMLGPVSPWFILAGFIVLALYLTFMILLIAHEGENNVHAR